MTYNQLIKEITTILESHVMIQTVKNVTPQEWLSRDNQPTFPVCCFSINNGSFNVGRQQLYTVQFFFLDKSGAEAEFEPDVISDQLSIAYDVVEKLRNDGNDWYIDDNVSYNLISDKYEDYLAGCELTINFYTQSDFDGCNFPI